jgi:LPXTG-motif cell wall-anchored protein
MQLRSAVTVAVLSAALLGSARGAAMAADGDSPLPTCEDVSTAYGDYVQKHLTATVDVPTQLPAGGDWQPATASVTNVGHNDLPDVRAEAYAWLQTEDPVLQRVRDYVKVEVKTKDGGWRSADQGLDTAGPAPLRTGETRHYQLRVRVLADVPKALDVSDFSMVGSFQDVYRFPDSGKEVACLARAFANDKFRIRPAAGTPTASATTKPRPSAPETPAKPTATATSSASATPSATSTATPAPSRNSGELAATGTSDSTVTLGATGGTLALLGAGTVLITRRRRT